MANFTYDGINFSFRDEGEGTPFLFQHGLGADSNQTFALWSKPEGFRLVTLECRGHGDTRPLGPEDRLSIPAFADDIRVLLDHLKIEKTIIGGISMGAATALHFALVYPQRVIGLVLSRPAWLAGPRESGFEVFAEIAHLIRRYGATQGAEEFSRSKTFQELYQQSSDNALSLLAQFRQPRAAETVAKLERIPKYVPAHSPADWAKIRVPTLLMANRKDLIHPFEYGEEYARAIPGSEFRELPPKSESIEAHVESTRRNLSEFLVKHFR